MKPAPPTRACERLLPNQRPYVITRAAYAGIQRYSTMWAGDNRSTWDALALSLPMFMTLGLSGEPFVGADVGGFVGRTDAELLVRWYEVGFLTPFCRNHADIGLAGSRALALSASITRTSSANT